MRLLVAVQRREVVLAQAVADLGPQLVKGRVAQAQHGHPALLERGAELVELRREVRRDEDDVHGRRRLAEVPPCAPRTWVPGIRYLTAAPSLLSVFSREAFAGAKVGSTSRRRSSVRRQSSWRPNCESAAARL